MTYTFLVRFDSPASPADLLRSLRQNLGFTILDVEVQSDIEVEPVPLAEDGTSWWANHTQAFLDSREEQRQHLAGIARTAASTYPSPTVTLPAPVVAALTALFAPNPAS